MSDETQVNSHNNTVSADTSRVAGANLGPFFKWAGSLRQTFAEAEQAGDGQPRKSTVTRKAATAYLRNKNIMLLKVRNMSWRSLGTAWSGHLHRQVTMLLPVDKGRVPHSQETP